MRWQVVESSEPHHALSRTQSVPEIINNSQFGGLFVGVLVSAETAFPRRAGFAGKVSALKSWFPALISSLAAEDRTAAKSR